MSKRWPATWHRFSAATAAVLVAAVWCATIEANAAASPVHVAAPFRPIRAAAILPEDDAVLPGPWNGAGCLSLAYFESGYDKLSAARIGAIVELVDIPAAGKTAFRAASERFNATLDALMHREIMLTLNHLMTPDLACATGEAGEEGGDVADLVQDETAKASAVAAYAAALARALPPAKVRELVITDLHLIRVIEVRMANIIFRYAQSRGNRRSSHRQDR